MNELKTVGRSVDRPTKLSFTCRVFGLSTRDVVSCIHGHYPVAEVLARDVRGRLRQQVAATCDDQFPRLWVVLDKWCRRCVTIVGCQRQLHCVSSGACLQAVTTLGRWTNGAIISGSPSRASTVASSVS